jgi:hypothetical protein
MTSFQPTVAFSSSATAPVARVKFVEPKIVAQQDQCQKALSIGVFFDGTRNNRTPYTKQLGYSNIARLFDAYPKDGQGISRVYIPGVGTPFPQIGELEHRTTGSAFALGGAERVLYAILALYNSVHRAAFSEHMYSPNEVAAMCLGKTDGAQWQFTTLRLGVVSDLRDDADDGAVRQRFLMDQQARLQELLEVESKVKIVECFVDVFGFSRGAAEARVFCSWFARLLKGGKFAGIPVRFRFLGIIDTVASSGFWDGIGNTIVNSTDGHAGWANAKSLTILPEVENCVHMVAMHELRKNFPLDEVAIDEVLPPNCQEYAYPGAHSDVGGGYEPGELGIAAGQSQTDCDAHKLSQIPLNHMYECAVAAGVPLSKTLAQKAEYDPFAIAPEVQSAFKTFLQENPSKPQLLSEWMRPFLAWRWQNRDRYTTLRHVKSASADLQLLLDSNAVLKRDGERLALLGDPSVSDRFVEEARRDKRFNLKNSDYKQEHFAALDPEAATVLKQAIAYGAVSPALAEFFDTYVHDSLAGFRKDLVEKTGYWRYRRTFRGDAVAQLSQRGDTGTGGMAIESSG